MEKLTRRILKEAIEETLSDVLGANNPDYVSLDEAVANFDKWFQGSKVVDENGDPLLCYHGTPTGGFTVFNTIAGVDKKTKWQLLFGSHFTNSPEQAEVYRDMKKTKDRMIYTVFLSIKNPIDLTAHGEYVVVSKPIKETPYAWSNHPEVVDAIHGLIEPRILKKYRLPDSNNECYNLWNILNDLTPFKARKIIEELGFDGIKYDARYIMGPNLPGYGNERRDVSWIALYPNQIKSATGNNGMFSPDSEDIYK